MIRGTKDYMPKIHESCFVVEESIIAGNVTMGEGSNVWFYAVVRGDVNYIKIGSFSNIQDGAIIHVTKNNPTIIGNYVTIGHGAKLHGCIIEDSALIGTGAIILDGAIVEEGAWVASGSVVPPGKVVPSGMLALGNPCKIQRELTEEEKNGAKQRCMNYAKVYPLQYI